MDDTNLFECVVTDEYEGYRIDKLISELIDSFSRSYLQKLIETSDISVNGNSIKPRYRLKADDRIAVNVPENIIPDIVLKLSRMCFPSYYLS